MNELPPISEVIKQYDLRADKSRGQNFLLDMNITARIAETAGDLQNTTIIEVGAGPGGLTRALLSTGAKVIAIETDTRFLPALNDIKNIYPNLQIETGDALQINFAQLTKEPYKIIANLPYNIATPLLLKWLDEGWHDNKWQPQYTQLLLMFQKEVAERIVATPATRPYGRLSVWAQWLCETQIEFELPPQVFVPAPKVFSSVVRLTPRPAPLYPAPAPTLRKILAAAFGQRRKMLRGSLKNLCSEATLTQAGIAGDMRPDVIDIEGFCRLAEALTREEKQ